MGLTRRAMAAGLPLAGALSRSAMGRTAAAAEGAVILAGGIVHPGNGPPAEAVAFAGGRILRVGPIAEVRAAAPGARELDMAGAAVLPGLKDCHAHMFGIGLREMTLNLEGCASIEELKARVRTFASTAPEGPIQGRGWIETHWQEGRFPTRLDIDAAVSDRPVFLRRADGHAAVANSRALALGGVTASTPDPAGGRILKEASGSPNGVLLDNAMALVGAHLPGVGMSARREAFDRADRLYAARGWTGLHNMSVSADDLLVLREMAAAGRLRIRVDNYMDPGAAEELFARGPTVEASGLLAVRGVKLYADGALGSRGAALLQPYADEPSTRGLLVTPPETLRALMGRAKAAGAQVAVHAIGDRGNRVALDAMQAVLGPGRSDRRWRVEHAQVLAPEDLPRFAAMGVIASMQPSHAIGDLYFAPARLGPERLAGAYAWRSLRGSGAVVCAGSDAPVEKGDPRIEFYAAIRRHALDGYAGADWGAGETVSRPEALAMLTRSAAYAVFRDGDAGVLRPGAVADVSVFAGDPMTLAPQDVLSARAQLTVVGGRIVHEG